MAGTERLKVNLVQGENRVQTVVRGQIEVPEAKPDVEKILSKEVKAGVRNVSIVPSKVVVDGTLALQVTYVAFKPDQSVHSMDGDVDFTTYVDVAGANPGMDYVVEFTVEDVNLTRSKTDPRIFDVAAVLSTFVKVTTVDELEILTVAPAGNQALETQNITVEHMVGEKTTKQIIVSDQFDVPEEKPDVEKIIGTKAIVKITGWKVLADKVIFDGEVKLRVMYVAADPEQSVHDLHYTFNLNDFVEIPEAQPGMNVHVQAEVESVSVQPKYGLEPGANITPTIQYEEDGLVVETLNVPQLTADAIIYLTVYVTETKTLTNVPTKLQSEEGFTKQILKVDREIGSASTQIVLREATAIPEEKPNIEKVLESSVERTVVTEKNILKDKVLIRGYALVEVVYVSCKPNQAVHAMHQRLHFRTFVPVAGAQPEMQAHVTVEPEFVSVDQKSVDVYTEAVFKVIATVTEISQPTVYVPTAVSPTVTPCPPTTYAVVPGDTLSNIAAANRVTVQMLLAINPQITNPDVIEVGQVIQIPCPAMG